MNKRPLDRWRRLQTAGTGDGFIEIPSIDSGVETGFGSARYAIGSHGQPRLLVPIGHPESGGGLTSTPKLLVTVSNFNLAGKGIWFIDVMSLDRALDSVFSELVEEILRRIEDGSSPAIAVEDSICDFRTLLKEHYSTDIADSKIIGLVGELEMLRKLSTHSVNAVKSWTGPYELRHDFRRDLHALEVKTSSRSDTTTVSIHGIDQLEPPFGGTLTLVHIRLERAEGGPLSISSVFNELIDLNVDTEALREALAISGCQDPYSEEWNRLAFTLEGFSAYSVRENFPRIISSSFTTGLVPSGVSGLEYRIDLNHAKHCELLLVDHDIAFKRISG